jgi:hypothetical protein
LLGAPRPKFHGAKTLTVAGCVTARFHTCAWRGRHVGHVHKRRHDSFGPAAHHTRFGGVWITHTAIQRRASKRGDELRFVSGQNLDMDISSH